MSFSPFFLSGLEQSTKMPVSGSASTGGSSGRGDAAGPPQLSLGSETVSRETDERNGQSRDGSPHATPLAVSAFGLSPEKSGLWQRGTASEASSLSPSELCE